MNEPVERRDRNGGGDCEKRKISYFSAVELAPVAAAAVAAKCIRCSMLRTFPHKFMHVYLLNRFKFSSFLLHSHSKFALILKAYVKFFNAHSMNENHHLK